MAYSVLLRFFIHNVTSIYCAIVSRVKCVAFHLFISLVSITIRYVCSGAGGGKVFWTQSDRPSDPTQPPIISGAYCAHPLLFSAEVKERLQVHIYLRLGLDGLF